MPPERIIRTAARLLLEQGWQRKAYVGQQGLDLEYALLQAADELRATDLEYEVAYRRVQSRAGNLVRWNDAPQRTLHDLLVVLLDAIDRPPPVPRPRKVLASMATGPHLELLRLTEPTFRYYARRRGYDMAICRESLDPSRPISWSKELFVRQLLQAYDLVFWVDADAAIVDPSVDIADELGSGLVGMVRLQTHESPDNPNAGVMLFRSDPRTFEFLDAVYERTEYIHHRWWDNAAILDVLGYQVDPPELRAPSEYYAHVSFLDPSWNVVPGAAPVQHPRIIHFPGHSQDARVEHLSGAVMSLWKRLIVPEVSNLELPDGATVDA